MSEKQLQDLDEVVKLPLSERVLPLVEFGRRVLDEGPNGAAQPLVSHLIEVLRSGAGAGHERLELGEVLGLLGDPRLEFPADEAYWIEVEGDGSAEWPSLSVGRFPVTNAEFFAFAEKGYDQREHWSEAGWAWLQSTQDPWPEHARRDAWKSRAHSDGAELVRDDLRVLPVVGLRGHGCG